MRVTVPAVAGGLALSLWGVALGQTQPIPPTPLPTPRTAPAPAAPEAQPAQPAAPAAPAAPAPAPPRPGVVTPGAPKRDPFDPLVTKPVEPAGPAGAEPGERRPPLSGLKLVGVVWDPKNRDQVRALVETPEGLGYYVRVNEEKFGGKVTAIERDRVRFTVREQPIPGGPARERTVELRLGGQ
jgi:hypothetical protein